MPIIAIDAMGGDKGPSVIVPAAIQVLRRHSSLKLIFVGREEALRMRLSRARDVSDRFEIQPAAEVVAMDESPALALRNKKDSSMRVAIQCVKEGRAQACVSAGNTGALMATARFVLKTTEGVDRPAIMARIPTTTARDTMMLDLGANVDSTPEQLLQFAVMATKVVRIAEGIASPSVALLNIGSEDIKGNEQVKKAAELFSHSSEIHYKGFIEGDGIFAGGTDIVVCDGFVGNSVLKACEGLSKLISHYAHKEIKRHWWTKLLVLPALPVLNSIRKKVDPRHRNGASLLGLNGVVIKSHGGADKIAFSYAIERALAEIKR
ncbi:MAG: phosphate acyltransferase [Gammaproteobacteria bacterium RIFCSPHIGHO2_12_FULL_42_13]|nr:MAG: phosphate acyltransferase [Gammaproteobacteria bacterium RIFCSPHIGHO2_12_FULL_42_13]